MTSRVESLGGGDFRLRLPDGRWLGFAERGEPSGRPVLVFHGLPGSRLVVAESVPGVRVVCPDRPGIGLSTYQRGRRLADWPSDVEALADALGLARFTVLGASAGGPYALACARWLPDRVDRAAVVGGMPPLAEPGGYRSMGARGIAWWVVGHVPGQAPVVAALQSLALGRSIGGLGLVGLFMSRSDRRLLARPEVRRALAATAHEAFRQGPRGVAREIAVLTAPWGFSPADITVPVDLWHGRDDRNVPIAAARFLAGMMPRCRTHFLDDAGHLMAGDLVAEPPRPEARAVARTRSPDEDPPTGTRAPGQVDPPTQPSGGGLGP